MGEGMSTNQQDDGGSQSAQPMPCKGPVIVCNDVEDWLGQQCKEYLAMYTPRPQTWGDLQHCVDRLAESGALGLDLALNEEIQTPHKLGSQQLFEADLSHKARRLADYAVANGLNKEMGNILWQDFVCLGVVLIKLDPTATMMLKLEIMGDNGCARWHRDKYSGRAVVTYNLRGTEYVDNKYVDFWELENCGKNECVLKDRSQVRSADVGGMLFMKGTKFPSGANGLIHKSPEPQFHANGNVMNRLLLKVDLF